MTHDAQKYPQSWWIQAAKISPWRWVTHKWHDAFVLRWGRRKWWHLRLLLVFVESRITVRTTSCGGSTWDRDHELLATFSVQKTLDDTARRSQLFRSSLLGLIMFVEFPFVHSSLLISWFQLIQRQFPCQIISAIPGRICGEADAINWLRSVESSHTFEPNADIVAEQSWLSRNCIICKRVPECLDNSLLMVIVRDAQALIRSHPVARLPTRTYWHPTCCFGVLQARSYLFTI